MSLFRPGSNAVRVFLYCAHACVFLVVIMGLTDSWGLGTRHGTVGRSVSRHSGKQKQSLPIRKPPTKQGKGRVKTPLVLGTYKYRFLSCYDLGDLLIQLCRQQHHRSY